MNRPLHFLHITTFYPPYSFGGDGVYVYRLCHALADAGHQVDVIHCTDSYHLFHPGEPEIVPREHPRVARHGLRSPLRWLSPLLSQQTGQPWLKRRAIREVMRGKTYDVVHYHNISLFGPGILTLPAPSAVKLYTAHEYWLVCPTHVLWKFDRRPCDRPQCLRCTLHARRPPQIWRYSGLRDRCASQVDLFLAPSAFTARHHAERGFPEAFVPLPIFTERCDSNWQRPGPSPHPRPYFLYVGRLETIKGPQTLLDPLKSVPGADLLVVGTGSQETRLRTLAGNRDDVRFLGARPQEELGRLYAHCVACVIPSLTFEPFPTVMAEAFARKAPVIARERGGLTDLVRESGGGLLYDNDDELVAAMQTLVSSPGLRDELGEKGYQTFVTRWTREAHLAAYLRLAEEVAQRRFRRVPWATDQPIALKTGSS